MKKTFHLIFFVAHVLSILCCSRAYCEQSYITNSITWRDTQGQIIEAHGGGMIKIGNTYYWIGEDKSHNSHTFKAINCYSSTDLLNWEFRNTIITKQTHADLNFNGRVLERPKVIYNQDTGKFVIWLHWDWRNYSEAQASVFYCNTIDGDYALHKHFRPFNKMVRDCTLFADEDGAAYFIAASNNNADLEIYKLTADYLDVESNIATLWQGSWREAPAMFKHNGVYFLITSGTTGWEPNQGKYAYAPSVAGPWSSLRNLGNSVTFDTQPTYVIPVQGTRTTSFIFCGDRWQYPDLKDSKYIWMPLYVNNSSLNLDYKLNWDVDTHTGKINTYNPIIPQANRTLHHVDSE